MKTFLTLSVFLGYFAVGLTLGQDQDGLSIEIKPNALTLEIGETAQLKATIRRNDGSTVEGMQVLFFGPRIDMSVTPSGYVQANRPGNHTITALLPDKPFNGAWDLQSRLEPGLRGEITVTVPVPPVEQLAFEGILAHMYAGTTLPVKVVGFDRNGQRRGNLKATLSVSGSAETDGFGYVTPLSQDSFLLTATVDGVSVSKNIEVRSNPTAAIYLEASTKSARTGDVVRFSAIATDSSGQTLDVPVTFALQSWPDVDRPESLGAGAAAQILDDGRFVAEQPGIYTVIAISGTRIARKSVLVTPRDVKRDIEFLGHARVNDRVTADFWVWEGIDGRDYAVHGTWNAEGHAYFYDVTDPTNMQLIDTVQVDARTVNDVMVSADGRICVISREGSSTRRNGIVLLDVTNPRDVRILSTFDEQLTGGVHNVFIYEKHVYAVNNGRRWDVINIEDPSKPFRISRFETDTPGRAVHDVWVRDGVAYQAGRTDGLIVIDVGGGGLDGAPSQPIEMGRLPQLTDWSHAVWPFKSISAGKLYVVGGDEAFYINPMKPDGAAILWEEGIPSRAKGWLHFVEFDDMKNPKEIARYQLPDSGPHNLWIDWEEEIMYVAHFDAGVRIVDVSGELIGDLYRQGREIGRFYSTDSEGFLPNAPFAWGPQPHKGTIFFTDFNSGLWAIRLAQRKESTDGNN